MMKKRAQGWGFDIGIGVAIFLIGIATFFFYSFNYDNGSQEIVQALTYDGDVISSSLLGRGYPNNWSEGDVVSIGLTTQNRINDTKLLRLYNMNVSNYQRTRTLLNTHYEYFFNFSIPMEIEGIGTVGGIGNSPHNQKDLIKITRFTIYKNKPVSLNLYVWR